MSYSSERQIIHSYIAQNWTTTPIRWDNTDLVTTNLRQWIWVQLMPVNSVQASFGAAHNTTRHTSILSIAIFEKSGAGVATIFDMADELVDLFKYKNLDGIQFRAPLIRPAPTPPVASFFQMNLQVEYFYDV